MTTIQSVSEDHIADNSSNMLQHRGEQLVLYRLRCAQTANGLSHYYMYGDVETEQTVL